jgi:uncharacterized protein (DUF2147 family)
MRRLLAVITAALAASVLRAEPGAAITGDWQLLDERSGALLSVVRIQVEKGLASGHVISVSTNGEAVPEPRCERCTGELENRPMVGLPIVKDLRLDRGAWRGGTILDPASGRLYDCLARLREDGKVLELRGYLGMPMFGRTLRWHRQLAQ